MAYGIDHDHKLGQKTESDLTTPQILLQNLHPIHMVATSLMKTLTSKLSNN